MDIERKLSSKGLVFLLLACAPLAMIGLANYNSPIAFVMVAAIFLLFKRYVKVVSWVRVVSPSMFSIYMIHSTLAGLMLIIKIEDVLMDGKCNVYVMFFVVTCVVFLCGLVIDLWRRLGVLLWEYAFR